jgi:endonuclease-3
LKTSEKIPFISGVLDELYPAPPIPLKHIDGFTLLVAVVLSAQCTDERVNKITEVLYKEASTPKGMLKLGRERIQEIIRPCGLSPQKSKAIYELSEILLEKHEGRVPDTFDDLEKLPGVGHKTASVVMSQVFNQPAFPVDTHIHRLAYRWGLSSGKNVVQTEKDLKRLFPKENWNKLHLQIIYFGREFCPARAHNKDACPICSKAGRKSLKR